MDSAILGFQDYIEYVIFGVKIEVLVFGLHFFDQIYSFGRYIINFNRKDAYFYLIIIIYFVEYDLVWVYVNHFRGDDFVD